MEGNEHWADAVARPCSHAKTLRNTMIGNFLDWCGVSIPCETGEAGMPVGFFLSALPGEDERLLAFSLFVESVIHGRDANRIAS